jgi:2-dehydro-3-deoxyphosphogluconate aldolase / (4S)-4-hydroxy-2-oxoglutarate aldolase
MTNREESIKQKLRESGIIAALPGSVPLADIVRVGDALLASPVLAVEVGGGPERLQQVADLYQRANSHMIIGAGGVETAVDAVPLIQAGAQFITSPMLDVAIKAVCQQHEVLYVPGIISAVAAQLAFRAECRMIRLFTGGPTGPDFVQALRYTEPEQEILVAGDFEAGQIGRYVAAGASALLVGKPLYRDAEQPLSDIISQARTLQQAWLTARESENGD